METVFSFIKDNISWIKDIFTVVFAGTATVIAILTYKRARATILQPIRNEVIKKQSELLTELLGHISHGIDDGLDYVGIAGSNSFLMLRDYGFVFKDHKEVLERTEKDIVGWLPCGPSNTLKDVRIIGVFEEKEAEQEDFKDNLSIGREKFENAKQGIIEIDKIYLTMKYAEFYNKLSSYAGSPFLPNSIQKALSKILKDVHTNLTKNLKAVLENVMKEFCTAYFGKNEIRNVSPVGVYNEFNHNRIHHRADFETLKDQIRRYLRIDEKW